MPKLWSDTIAAHRSAVADAIVDTAVDLASRDGLQNLTMARIAKETGIGRATLYKYFASVEQILVTWHSRQIAGHLELFARLRRETATPLAALEALLLAYGEKYLDRRERTLGAFLHALPHMEQAQRELRRLVESLIREATASGALKPVGSTAERAKFALSAITSGASGKAELVRLVQMIMRGLGANSAKA
jgi:AcrR family transcriptional regulator